MASQKPNDMAENFEEALKKPHRATPVRGGIYPLTGVALAIIALIALTVYFSF